MSVQAIHFDDAQAYERGMGAWSQQAGQVFIDWLEPPAGYRWIDIGCGSGVFSELLVHRCAPAELQGIDPSPQQLSFARARPGLQDKVFLQGDAMALPFDDNRFDAAVMALVLFFVSDPVKGVAEMRRVTRPGGIISAYVWDMLNDASPAYPIQAELRARGLPIASPPRADISAVPALRELWTHAGLEAVETREITVQRRFVDFEDFWQATTGMPSGKKALASVTPAELQQIKAAIRASLPADAAGHVTCQARANAIKGRVPIS
ncbi:MAG: methyltransferase domain-containing protein [Dongiaceae bacterium]